MPSYFYIKKLEWHCMTLFFQCSELAKQTGHLTASQEKNTFLILIM